MGKGEKTRQQILEKALQVFEDKRYENGSINEIAKRLGVRSSLIYYYFRNKSHIYLELVSKFRDGLLHDISIASKKGDNTIDRITNLLFAYEEYIKKNRSLYDIFREIEFVEKDFAKNFYRKIANKIEEVLDGASIEGVDIESLSYAIIGSAYFIVLKNLVWDGKHDVSKEFDTLKKFIEKGIDAKMDFIPYIVEEKSTNLPKIEFKSKGERTRYELIKSSEKLFGEKGYERTQISDIAYETGVGLGTFYLYFKSKKEILEEVVKNVNMLLRFNSREYLKGLADRREIENAGLQAFFYQFKNMGNDYRIVREAEFVDREIGIWYYTRIGSSYSKGLEEGMKIGEIYQMDSETLAYILMGISHTVGIKWFVLEDNKEINKKSVLSILEFVMHGLRGIEKGRIEKGRNL